MTKKQKNRTSGKSIRVWEYFFPVLADMNQINEETETNKVSNNAWDLVEDKEEYEKVMKKINETRSNSNADQDIVYI